MKKTVITLAIVIPAIVIIGGFILYSSVNSIIRTTVQTYGPEITKTDITLDKVKISPLSGKGGIEGLIIGNPEGYHTTHLASIGKVELDIDLKSLKTDTIIINDIRVIEPDFIYEMGLTKSNLGVVMDNIEEYCKQFESGEETPETDDAPKKGVIIKRFIMKDAKVQVSAKILKGKTIPISLSKIELTDIGSESSPATIAEAILEITQAIFRDIMDALKRSADVLKQHGVSMIEGTKRMLNTTVDEIKNIDDTVKRGTENVKEGVKKLWGKVKGDDDD